MRYRVRLRKGDREIEVESEDKEFVELKLNEFQAEVRGAQQGESVQSQAVVPQPSPLPLAPLQKPPSLVELRKLVNAQSGTENTITVAYYLEKFKGQPEYTSKQLIQGLKELGCSFSNYYDVVLKTKQGGFLMEGSSKKNFRLTQTGENWIESRLRSKGSPEAN